MINCTITSPKKTMVYKNLKSITLPAFSGQAQILSSHAEYFLVLKKGNVIFHQASGSKDIMQILNGECYVKKDVVIIIL